jgi:general secretion pathway protein B
MVPSDGASTGTPIPPPAAAPLPPLRLDELPASIRRAIPALRIDGHVQSPSAANRMLVVNGQPLREKETLVPGLQLESVADDGAIFTWRGQRFQVPYPGASPRNP